MLICPYLITQKHKNVSIDHGNGIVAIEEENAQDYLIVCHGRRRVNKFLKSFLGLSIVILANENQV